MMEFSIDKVEKQVSDYLTSHPSITNRELRRIAGVSYDQAIAVFHELIARGILKRIGSGSGTKYIRDGQG
jgi:predicted HTH transcriptional regulator